MSQLNTTNHKSEFHNAYTSQFALPAEMQQQLTHYKYLKWDSDFFLGNWESNAGTYAAGTIHRYNQLFHVQFCHSLSIGALKQLRDAGESIQLALSFRKAAGMPAYVLVSAKV